MLIQQGTVNQNFSLPKVNTQSQPNLTNATAPLTPDDQVTLGGGDSGVSFGRAALGTAVGAGVGALTYAGIMSGGVMAHVAGAGALGLAGVVVGGGVGIGLDLMNMFGGGNDNYTGKLATTGAVIGAATGAIMGLASGNPIVAGAAGLATGGALGLATYAISGIGNLYNK